MKPGPPSCRALKLLLGLGLLNLGICVIFPNCGLLGAVDVPIGNSKVLNQLSSGPFSSLGPAIDRTVQRHSTPVPEFKWNAIGLWKKIRTNPDTYVPKGYATTPPDEGTRGTWFVDARDGKRLFVPSSSFKGYSRSVWEMEARKITANREFGR